MKRYRVLYAAAGIVALVAIGYLAFGWQYAFNNANFSSILAENITAAIERGTLSADYEGVSYPMDSTYADGLLRVLQRGKSELEKADAAPERYDDLLTLYLGDLTLNVYQPNIDEDFVIYERVQNGKSTYQSLSGYRTMDWLKDAIGIPAKE